MAWETPCWCSWRREDETLHGGGGVGDESEVVNIEENGEECNDVWGREGQGRVITLYGVDQAVGRAVMVGNVV
jgi:hypothetical protein